MGSRNRPPRILVLSASVGGGHLRAAQAVELALRETAPEAAVENVDVLELTNAAFRRIYGEAYIDLVNRAPIILGYLYDLFDRPVGRGGAAGDRLRLAVEKLNLASLLKFLRSSPWDAVVNTHFLPAEIIASLKGKGSLAMPQLTVTTDFETHRLWVNQPCEHYFTATEEGASYLRHWGVPGHSISVVGIPVHPAFTRLKSREECRRKLGVRSGRPVVLQLAGGFGVGPIEKIYRALLETQVPLEVVVVAGRNETARRQIEAVPVPERHRARVVGFTDSIQDFMRAADLVASKPGGLTSAETLAAGAGMVIINPIPGQESRNNDYLLENGAAVKINNVATLADKLTRLLGEPKRVSALQAAARRLARPRAAFEAARKALELAGA